MLRPLFSIMLSSLSLLPFLSLFAPASAFPANLQPQSPAHPLSLHGRDAPSDSQIQVAKGMFPRIDWDFTATTGCTSNQFAILVESTRMALELMKFTGEDLREAYGSTGFNKYFINSPDWFKLRIWEFANLKYFQVLNWPTEKPAKDKRQYKTVYYCNQPDWSFGCNKANKPPAYTPDIPTRDPVYPRSNSVVFCPKFWTNTFRYVNDITVTPRPISAIDDLHSYEHVMIHEWFHNTQTDSGLYHVRDLRDDYGDGERNIYGSYACQHYAWRDMLQKGSGIMFQTMENADSFAWMISYNWYKGLMGWQDDGTLKPGQKEKRQDVNDDDPTLPLDPDTVDPDDVAGGLPQGPPGGMPENTTFDRTTCPDCMVTEGGCVLIEDCRFPEDDGSVNAECTHCTCDVSKTDNSPTTTDIALTDARCNGWSGTLPPNYAFPPAPTTPGVHSCAASSDCGTGCCDNQSHICSTPENSTCM